MLKKSLRLRTKEDFERVFRKGKPIFFGAVACKVSPNSLGHVRLGFSLSKKHLTAAASRNRLRRILSEPFSRHLAAGEAFPAVDVAFFTVKKLEGENTQPFASVAENVVKYIQP